MLARLNELPEHKQRQIKEMYDTLFPFEVRALLEMKGWIERQPWYKLEQDATAGVQIFQSLLLELNKIQQTADNLMVKRTAEAMLTNIQVNHTLDPVFFVRHLYQQLLAENEMVKVGGGVVVECC